MKTCLLALVLLCVALPARAQTPPIVNPDAVEFTPSPNHGDPVTATGGLTRYMLEIVSVTAPTTVLKTVDLAKPAPVSGKITVSGLKQYFVALPDGSYVAVVKAEGPGGVSLPSVLSDPFTVAAALAPGAPGKPVWKALTANSRTPPASAPKRRTGSS